MQLRRKAEMLQWISISILGLILLAIPNSGVSQSNNRGYLFKSNLRVGYSYHPNNPVDFPISYTDAQLIPDHQESVLGYQASIICLKELNGIFSIGVSGSLSNFGFVETGEELSFWSSKTHPYQISREFKMYGVGLMTGINIVKRRLDKASLYFGVRYEDLLSSKGVFLWRDSQNKDKFAAEILVEYGHLLTKNIYLTIGLNSVIGLTEFYEYIPYKPMRYGISIGLEYDVR